MPHHDTTKINALLQRGGAAAAGRVAWFESIDSTNTWLMNQTDAHARVCIAEWQSAGRGRRGRAWRTPRCGAVLLSIGWNLDGAAGGAAGLSLVSGLAALDALRRLGVDAIGLKWPNDILARGRKLGGILTELNGDRCVIGMGVNVAPESSPESLPESSPELQESPAAADETPRTDLHSLGFGVDRDQLAAELILAHCDYLRRFCATGLAAFVDQWNAAHAYRGRAVTVRLGAESFRGIARGIDADGALLIDACEPGGARRRILSGEARVRPLEAVSP